LSTQASSYCNRRLEIPTGSLDEPDFHLDKLRPSLPPLVSTTDYVDFQPAYHYGFLNLGYSPSAWVFTVRLANLTKTSLPNIHVRIKYNGSGSLHVASPSDVRLANGKPLTMRPVRSANNVASLFIDKLDSGRQSGLIIYVATRNRPPSDAFQITADCPEGIFEQMTPIQYQKIGWNAR